VSPFAMLRHLDGNHPGEAQDRRSSLPAIARAVPIRIFVARCEEDHALDISGRAAMLKLLMSQFLTQKSVCKAAVCATYVAKYDRRRTTMTATRRRILVIEDDPETARQLVDSSARAVITSIWRSTATTGCVLDFPPVMP
jgi:hypothetical protein